MATAAVIKDLLNEYQSRLGLDGSSAALIQGQDIYHEVEQWCKVTHISYMPTITLLDDKASADHWPYKEDSFTHIFAGIKDLSKASLQYLKWVQWSLKYKGVTILTLAEDCHAKHGDIVEFVENASFERGRIRVLDRRVDGASLRVVIAMKWDLLSA